MESKVKILGHSVHPILIVFPLGLLTVAVIFELIHYFSVFRVSGEVGFWMTVSGIIGGLIAAVFGLIDWIAIPPKTRAWNVGLYHGIVNVIVVALFALSTYTRLDNPGYGPGFWSLVLSTTGVVLSLIGGWLGGELVHRLNVSNDTGAHLNSPSSLSGRPAGEDVLKGV
jgi:uncharacterized membrane protein